MAKRNKIKTLRGFKDYYPEDKAFLNWFYENLKKVSELYGYREYDGPTLEKLDLYAAKSGEEIVQKQSFVFEDRGGRTVTLRPEMTPTLAKMVANRSKKLTFPVRWYSFGRRYRYEKPQKGRGREFYQWDIDILGSNSYLADAEIISIAASFYKSIGLEPDEVVIKINSRELLTKKLRKIGVKKGQLQEVINTIDKKEKLTGKKYNEMLESAGLNKSKRKKLSGFLKDNDAYKKDERLNSIFSFLTERGLDDYIKYDPTIARAFNYYTSTVFEGWDIKGNLRSLWGGGRYDNLTSDVGSKKKVPGVGFAMGDMVLYELLKKNKKLPDLTEVSTKVLVTIFDKKHLNSSLKVINILRQASINSEIYPDPKAGLKKQLKYADKKNIPYAVIIGPDEIVKNEVTLKDLKNNSQETISRQSLLARVK